MIIIHLGGQPVGKGRPRISARGGFARAYTPAKTREYEARLAAAAREVMGNKEPLIGPLAVVVRAQFDVPKSWTRFKRESALLGIHRHVSKPDADNVMKTLDALNGIVWADDAQVCELYVRKDYSDNPMLTVSVAEI